MVGIGTVEDRAWALREAMGLPGRDVMMSQNDTFEAPPEDGEPGETASQFSFPMHDGGTEGETEMR